MRKKREVQSEHEVDYEVHAVEYETPVRPSNEFDAGHCWCGKQRSDCKGNPTRVIKLDTVSTMFVCPFGRDETQISPKVFEAARKAGLV
jgi:hypothetical protein